MNQNGGVLEPPELERFITEGYLVVRSAFPTELAEECRRSAAQQLDIDLARPNTWRRPVVRGVPTADCFRRAANAPRLLDVVGQVVNPDAWQTRPNLGAFVVRFPSEEDPGDAGWHIDSSFQPPGDSRWFGTTDRKSGRCSCCAWSPTWGWTMHRAACSQARISRWQGCSLPPVKRACPVPTEAKNRGSHFRHRRVAKCLPPAPLVTWSSVTPSWCMPPVGPTVVSNPDSWLNHQWQSRMDWIWMVR